MDNNFFCLIKIGQGGGERKMTFEDFYKLNKDQIERLWEAKAYMGLIKFVWNDGFRMGYGASYFLPTSSFEKNIEKNLREQIGIDYKAMGKKQPKQGD